MVTPFVLGADHVTWNAFKVLKHLEHAVDLIAT